MKAFFFTYRGAIVLLCLLPAIILSAETPGMVNYVTGTVLMLLGQILRLLALRRIGGRGKVHSAGTTQLSTSGIYGHLRSPLYLGNIFFLSGAAALYFPLMSIPVVSGCLFGLYTLISVYEEQCLHAELGAPYTEYIAHVPRWTFRWKAFQGSAVSRPAIAWPAVFRFEKSSLCMFLAVTACASVWHLKLFPLLNDSIPSHLHVPVACAAVIALCTIKFLRIAAKVRHKRGTWLKFHALCHPKTNSL